MSIRILQADVHLINLQTRLPFKYGIAVMTRAPQAYVRLFVDVDGRKAVGVAADLLPPRWFTKVADKPLDLEIAEMLEVIDHAVACATGVEGKTVFDVWRQVYERQVQWGCERRFAPLLVQFGASLAERALIEAFCRSAGRPFGELVRENQLGIRLDHFHGQLQGRTPGELLPASPHRRVIARHTVGMADPLEETEIAATARVQDGLPQSLTECIRRYGLKHFKLKASGNVSQDVGRLTHIADVITQHVAGEFALTVDGNESFRSLSDFREFWETLRDAPRLSQFLDRMMFVEQPFHRDVALDPHVLGELLAWTDRPMMIIDESDAELSSLPRALSLGYHGTSHKNCKGVFKSIAHACLLEKLRRESPNARFVLSGEDLANVGPVALQQDLAVAATLGVNSVERNGHHYFAGLSAYPESVQQQALQRHGDLYQTSSLGWPTLNIRDGEFEVSSVVDAPFGVGFELDVAQFTPRTSWSQ